MSWPARRPAVPANCNDLNLEVVEHALVDARGNVTAAARSLSVPSVDLRKLVWADAFVGGCCFRAARAKDRRGRGSVASGAEEQRSWSAASGCQVYFEAKRVWAAARLGRGARRGKSAEAQPVKAGVHSATISKTRAKDSCALRERAGRRRLATETGGDACTS
jgi:hypothetical protein